MHLISAVYVIMFGKGDEVMENTYTKKERNLYLLGLLGQNMIYNIIATGMTYYFQSVIFIPAMAISVIMAVARIWDAINDPMMGTIAVRILFSFRELFLLRLCSLLLTGNIQLQTQLFKMF